MNLSIRLCAGVALLMAISPPAHAYLDPVTGSLIVQGLIATIAGVVAGMKSIRTRIIKLASAIFFSRKH